MMSKAYRKLVIANTITRFYFFSICLAILFSCKNASAQEITPGGGSGSYNLTEPTGTGVAWNYGIIGIGNDAYARPGTTYPGPFQTHNWWNSAFWNLPANQLQPISTSPTDLNSSHDMFPLPMMVKELSDGISFGYRTLEQQTSQPTDWVGKNATLENANYDLTMHCYANPTDNGGVSSTTSVVDDYGDWHVKLGQNMGATKVSTTLAKGNPFAFFEFTGPGTPVFGAGNGGQIKVVAVYKNAILISLYSGGNSGNPIVSTVNPEGFYAFYFPVGTQVSGNDNNFKNISSVSVGDFLSPLKIKLPAGQTQFTMSVMPNGDQSTLELYEPHAYCVITDTRFTYAYNPTIAKVTNTFTTTTQAYNGYSNAPGTINVLFRHHYIFPPASGLVNPSLVYHGPRGLMKILEGNSFSTEMYYNGSLPQLGKAQRAFDTTFVNTELNYIASHRYIVDPEANFINDHDDYASFKLAAQACRAAQMAHQLKNYAARDKLIAAAKVIIEDFLKSPNGDAVSTVYSSKLNFMTTFPNSFEAYAGMYDYHFVVGHLIYACAQVGQFESKFSGNKNWVNQWQPMVDLLVRSIDDWNRDMTKPADPAQPWFPYLRFFDPYAGHSWWSNSCVGQEAINESVQFAQGAFMWGELTDNKAMRDMGAMIYTTESEAGKQYWFDYDNATMGAPFAPDYTYGHTGYLRESGYLYQTAASGVSISPIYNPKINSPEQIFGVTEMPFGAGSSLWMGFPFQGAKNEYQDFLKEQSGGFIGDNEWENAYDVNSFLAFTNALLSKQQYQSVFMPMNPPEGAEYHLMKLLPYQFITTLDSVGRVDIIRADIPLFSTFVKDTCNTWLRHYMMYNSPGTGADHEARIVHFTDGTCWWLPKDTLITYKLMGPDSVKTIAATGGACENDVINISVVAKICHPRDPSMTYQYSKDNVHWTTLYNVKTVSDSLHVSYTPTVAGTYFFRAIMHGDSVPGLMCPLNDTTDHVAKVTVNTCCPLKIDTAIVSNVTCSGSTNGKIVITASHGTAPYQYSVDSGLTVRNSNTFDTLRAGTYHVYVKDAASCVKRIDVIVKELSSIIVTKKDSVNIKCFGDTTGSATIAVSGGSGSFTYQWNDPHHQTTPMAISLSAGAYAVKVTDQNSCNISVNYELTQAGQLNISSIDITKVGCFGDSTGALKVNVTGGVSPYHYLWNSTNSDTSLISGLKVGTYTVKVSDKNGCTTQSQADVKSPAVLAVTITKNNQNCFGAANSGVLSADVTGGVASYSYQWDAPGSGNVDSVNNLGGGTYHLTVTDANQCTAKASSTILQSSAINYTTSSVSPSCGNSDGSASVILNSGSTVPYQYNWDSRAANQNSATAVNLGSGWYSFTITDGVGCIKKDSVKVNNLNGVAFVSSSHTDPSCFGKCDGSATSSAQGGVRPYTYIWNKSLSVDSFANGLCAGSYQLTVSDQNNCSDVANFVLAAPGDSILKLSIAPATTAPLCVQGSLQVITTVSGGTKPYITQWDADASISDATVLNPVISPTVKTTYKLKVTDKHNCDTSATITLQPSPTVDFNVDTVANCENIKATFTAITNAVAPYQSKWFFSPNDSSSNSIASFVFSQGSYTVKLLLTDANSCSDTISKPLSFFNKTAPFASFAFLPQQVTMLNPTVDFSNLSTNATSYRWTFGNGDSTYLASPSYTYLDSGLYSVCLRAMNEFNCYMDTCAKVHVNGIETFFVPNAFTPGTDGKNNLFVPVALGLDPGNYQMEIFNRWGELFFSTNDLNTGWDGTYKGRQVQMDVYVWKIDAKELSSSKRISKIGSVTLIR